jgi:predicted ATPase
MSGNDVIPRLAVFMEGCTLEAAEAVYPAAGELEIDLLDGMASLVDKSLLGQEEQADGEPRFVMLETVREYALERVAQREAEALGGNMRPTTEAGGGGAAMGGPQQGGVARTVRAGARQPAGGPAVFHRQR